MLDLVKFYGRNGWTIEFNDSAYHINLEGESGFTVEVAQRTPEAQNKMFAHGEWPTRNYAGGMTITLQGSLSYDNSDDYNAGRITFVNSLRGSPDDEVIRKDGTLQVQFSGQAEPWECDVRIVQFTAPLGGASPSRSPFLLTLYSFLPYFIGSNTGIKYYYS